MQEALNKVILGGVALAEIFLATVAIANKPTGDNANRGTQIGSKIGAVGGALTSIKEYGAPVGVIPGAIAGGAAATINFEYTTEETKENPGGAVLVEKVRTALNDDNRDHD